MLIYQHQRATNDVNGNPRRPAERSARGSMMTYRQLLKTPKCGWKHADDDHMLAALCEASSYVLCLRGQALWEWARQQRIGYRRLLGMMGDMRKRPLDALCCVVEGLPWTGAK